MIYIQKYTSPLGGLTMASDEKFLTGLWFDDQKYFGSTLPEQYEMKNIPIFATVKSWLDTYFQGRKPDFTPPLLLEGTAFRKMVWDVLLTIPYGKTMTYGEIAAVIAGKKGIKSMSAQAVGSAVGHNPISIIVPCHRVIGTNGSLTGYAGGLDKKEKLLAYEISLILSI